MKEPGNKAMKDGLKRLVGKYAKEQDCEPQAALRDLLADLRHLSREMGLDFHDAAEGSYDLYLDERYDGKRRKA
jgi:hypothetical protein